MPALVLGGVLVFGFASSPLGERYGDAVDYYVGGVYLVLLAIISLLALQAWWTTQQEPSRTDGAKPTRLERAMKWWYHWSTDWNWRDDNR